MSAGRTVLWGGGGPHGVLMWWRRTVALAAGMCVACSASVAAESADGVGDFAQFLAGRDLVVEGQVLDAEEGKRQMLGTCGVSPLGPYPVLEVRLAIDRVWVGVADDSIIEVTMVGPPQFPNTSLVAGARVLFWGNRDCHDGWRTWGSAAIITGSGYAIVPLGWEEKINRADVIAAPPRYATLISAVEPLIATAPVMNFQGAKSLALVRVADVSRGSDYVAYDCDSLAVVYGDARPIPPRFTWRVARYCYPRVAIGDTLLVPLEADAAPPSMALRGCPSALRVQGGFVSTLGVTIPFLRYALEPRAEGFRVRPFVARDW